VSVRAGAWQKGAEILLLGHQLAVALRERPRVHSRLMWPDRAWLVRLAGMLPADRLAATRLIVTPPRSCGAITTSSADAGPAVARGRSGRESAR
jgi:hypothetical protein